MIPKECKRLAEVDFPIAVVSRHSAREKSIRHGHPSTLHLWWARRPLAACRAMLMALLLPDPCDPNCSEGFKQRARSILPRVQGKPGAKDIDLRNELLRFIGDFANWDNSNSAEFVQAARGLVRAAHGEESPLVVDPFAGGGSIPVEALRVGCEAFASDLNPVACLILKTLLEDIPRHGTGVADYLPQAGAAVKAAAVKQLADFYPPDPDGSTPIAYLWARTIICDNCGAEIPLLRSFWLCKKTIRRRALRFTVRREKSHPPQVVFEIFEPKRDSDVPPAVVSRAKARCLCCNVVMPPDRVRTQLREQRGGADAIFDVNGMRVGGALLLAVVSLNDATSGRKYRLPSSRDYEAVWKAGEHLKKVLEAWKHGGGRPLCPVPDEPLPPQGTLGFRVQLYGMLRWGDLFTARQKLGMVTLSQSIADYECDAELVKSALAQTLSHVVERSSSLSRWRAETYMETVEGVYGRQALPIVWDFAEAVPLSEST